MIISHLSKSMPHLLADLRDGVPSHVLLEQLREKTRGDWLRVSEAAIREHGDYVAGAYEGRVVSVYRITGHRYDSMPATHRRVTFEVEPAPELGRLVGQPCPGGPWKRGEARPVRYFATADVRRYMDRELDLPKPDLDSAATLEAIMADQLEALSRPLVAGDGRGSLLDEVELALNPRGGVIVTVPAGTRVLVVPRQS